MESKQAYNYDYNKLHQLCINIYFHKNYGWLSFGFLNCYIEHDNTVFARFMSHYGPSDLWIILNDRMINDKKKHIIKRYIEQISVTQRGYTQTHCLIVINILYYRYKLSSESSQELHHLCRYRWYRHVGMLFSILTQILFLILQRQISWNILVSHLLLL